MYMFPAMRNITMTMHHTSGMDIVNTTFLTFEENEVSFSGDWQSEG